MKVKTILGVLAAASLFFSVNVFAQENANRDENGNVVRGPYETNGFWDNTYLGVGAGVNVTMPNLFQFGGVGLGTDINFGKWITPAVGTRIGWQGITAVDKILTTGSYAGDPDPNAFGMHFFHADFMWSFVNSFWGYKETRVWNPALYLSTGLFLAGTNLNADGLNAKIGNKEYGMGWGINNIFRLGSKWDFNLDLRMIIEKESAISNGTGSFYHIPSVFAGFAYKFGKTNFDRHSSITPVVVPVPFTTEQYNDLADRVAELEKENAELKDKVAELQKIADKVNNLVDGQTYVYENGDFTAVDVNPGAPVTVYFDCGSTTLSQREKAHLEFFANAIDKEKALDVVGSADSSTGSAKRNAYLANKRAEVVKDYLVNAGFNADNITLDTTVDAYDTAVKSRVATVSVK